MVVKPKSRGFICLTAHPQGCYKNVQDMAKAAKALNVPENSGLKNVLVVGCSGGYGLASRIVAAFGYRAATVGVSFESQAAKNRTATAGFYNNCAFDRLAAEYGLPAASINGDAFSNETKTETAAACKKLFHGEGIDLLIYSIGAPRRTDPVTGDVYRSVIKPIGTAYTNKTVDFHTGQISEVTIEPATKQEAEDTVKVMGGEDWKLWIDRFRAEGLLAEGFRTMAYSYIGPELTHPIYKDGTIGKAKDDLTKTCMELNRLLYDISGQAFVSVNKALVTQSSSAIPVVPLYISMLYKIMKQKGLHEGCYEQMARLFTEQLYAVPGKTPETDALIRMDDLEMRADVQAEIDRLWPLVSSENIDDLLDLAGYRSDFFSIFGFGREDMDYEQDVEV